MFSEEVDSILNSNKSEKEKQEEALDRIQLELEEYLNEYYAKWN